MEIVYRPDPRYNAARQIANARFDYLHPAVIYFYDSVADVQQAIRDRQEPGCPLKRKSKFRRDSAASQIALRDHRRLPSPGKTEKIYLRDCRITWRKPTPYRPCVRLATSATPNTLLRWHRQLIAWKWTTLPAGVARRPPGHSRACRADSEGESDVALYADPRRAEERRPPRGSLDHSAEVLERWACRRSRNARPRGRRS